MIDAGYEFFPVGGGRHFRNRNKLAIRSGFTLIELLTVVAALSLLMVLAVPAVQDFGRSYNLKSAGNQMVALAGQARQNSIARGALTVLVMAGSGPERQRAAAIFEVRMRENGSALQSSDWKQVSRWNVLPVGIVFDTDSSATLLADETSALMPPLPAFSYQGVQMDRYKLVVFRPDGGLYQAGNVPISKLRLVEGVIDGAGVVHYPQGEDSPNFYEIIFLPTSGRLKIERN